MVKWVEWAAVGEFRDCIGNEILKLRKKSENLFLRMCGNLINKSNEVLKRRRKGLFFVSKSSNEQGNNKGKLAMYMTQFTYLTAPLHFFIRQTDFKYDGKIYKNLKMLVGNLHISIRI